MTKDKVLACRSTSHGTTGTTTAPTPVGGFIYKTLEGAKRGVEASSWWKGNSAGGEWVEEEKGMWRHSKHYAFYIVEVEPAE